MLAVGDVANPMMAIVMAKQACQFSRKVTIYTHGSTEVAAAMQPMAEAKGIRVESRIITKLVKSEKEGGEMTIIFENGEEETVGFLVHKPTTVLNGPFAEQLGVELTLGGDIKVGQPFPETTAKGVFAAGDCATYMKMMSLALAAGVTTAAGVSMQLMQG